MGRKKIKIEPIQEGRNRQVTYLKRKAGLFKKAHELATLTDSQVAVIVFGHNGRLSQFCSGDIDQVLLRYTEFEGNIESKGPRDFAGGRDDDDDDEEDDKPNDHKYRGGPSGGGRGGGGGPGGGGGAGASGSSGGFHGSGGDSGPSSSTDNGQGSTGGGGGGGGTGFSGPSPSSGGQSYTGTSRQRSNAAREDSNGLERTHDGDDSGETDTSSSSSSPSPGTSALAPKSSLRAAVLSKCNRSLPLTGKRRAASMSRTSASPKVRVKDTKGKTSVKQEYQEDDNGGFGSAPRIQVPMSRGKRKLGQQTAARGNLREQASVLKPMPSQTQSQLQPQRQPQLLTRSHGSIPNIMAHPPMTGNTVYGGGPSHPQTMDDLVGPGSSNVVQSLPVQSAPGSYNTSPYPSGPSTPVGGPWVNGDAGAPFPMAAGPSSHSSHIGPVRRNSLSQPPEGMAMMPYAPRPNTAGTVMDRGNGSLQGWSHVQQHQHAPHTGVGSNLGFARPGPPSGGGFHATSVDSGMTAMRQHHTASVPPSSHNLSGDVQAGSHFQTHTLREASPLPLPPQPQQAYTGPFAPEAAFAGNVLGMSAMPSASSRCGSVSSASLSMSRPGTDDYNSGAPPSACDTPLLGPLGGGSSLGINGGSGKSMAVGAAADAALNEWVANTLLPQPVVSSEGLQGDASFGTMGMNTGAPMVKVEGLSAVDEAPVLAGPRTVSSQLMEAGLHTFTPTLSDARPL